tara:strand:- start:1868 stop:5629 length:3762 start_codon:yes stop_codon:yes gene_type:complete
MILPSLGLMAQLNYSISWKGIVKDNSFKSQPVDYMHFEGASYDFVHDFFPRYVINLELNPNQSVRSVGFSITGEKPLDGRESQTTSINEIGSNVNVEIHEYLLYNRKYCRIEILPLYKKGTSIYKVESFTINPEFVQSKNSTLSRSSRASYATNSVLGGGTWYKIAIVEDGIYKIDSEFLKRIGIDPKSVKPNSLRIYGNGGGMLPEDNATSRIDDLAENPVWVSNPLSESFTENDNVLFYGEGPHEWKLSGGKYQFVVNVYSDTNYYFMTFDGGVGNPLKISDQSNIASSNPITINYFNDYQSHEEELSNLISSGRQWVGENFGVKGNQYYEFSFPNIETNNIASVDVHVAMRSLISPSTMKIGVSGLGSGSITSGVNSGGYLSNFATNYSTTVSANPTSSKLGINLTYEKANGESVAWLDRIVVNCDRKLIYSGGQMPFSVQRQSESTADYQYVLDGVNSFSRIWDITNPVTAKVQKFSLNGRQARFNREGGQIEKFIVFTNNSARVPEWGIKIPNQNLHALVGKSPDMVIYTKAEFSSYAEEVAELHRENDGLSVEVVNVLEVYNEFSCGRQDVVALRDFMRMLYKSANGDTSLIPRYLLLFGDASYDYKDRVSGNTNVIPVYQTQESFDPIASLATDDFYAMLADDYNDLTNGIVHLGVGRFPVKNARQAAQAVNKLKNYNTINSLGKWRLALCYIADDEDGNLHMDQANNLSDSVDAVFPNYNINKVLADAYPQRSTPGGQRYPDVNQAIDEAVEQGSLTLNYVGHGGELGWAHERILEVSQINKWSNINNMPLFVTATCEFSRFDDPKRTSAGEFVFLNPDGAGIGLLTTTRVVYASPNYALAQTFNRLAYGELNGNMPRLGDIVQQTKLDPNNFNDNTRVFALLGDPAMKLNYPIHKVETTSRPDTMGALQKVTISGQVVHNKTGSLLSDFNGTLYPVVYDKKRTVQTLNNDGDGVFEFGARINILFRGKATITNGKFTFTFVVPKDIDFNYGNGKISYYAENGSIDAAGFDTMVVVGGQVGDPLADQIGPDVKLYMNDTTFVFGGMTSEDPSIYAKVYDESGINTSGGGIGHDIVAVLDEDTKDELVLNDYYESVLNSYQKGIVRYPFKDMSEGRHTLSLKAWDVYNNSGQDRTEFVVSKSAELALDHVLNYPNPFTTNTDFYFEHNYPDRDLMVRIQVFTVSGKIVKTIDGYYNSKGFRIGPIKWDGRDDFGDKIGRGVYVYKVEVKAPNGDVADKIEKLVILN